MKVIAIGGEPGSGKSTLMKRIIEHFKMYPKYDAYKLVPYLINDNIYVLGKYEEGEVFSGTDRMSMAVQPEAIKFLAQLQSNAVVLFEGDRLFTSSFLEDCTEKYDTQIFYLKTTKDVRTERYKERGSNQDETWLRGRESKIANILTNMTLMFNTETFENNDLFEQEIIFHRIIEEVKNG